MLTTCPRLHSAYKRYLRFLINQQIFLKLFQVRSDPLGGLPKKFWDIAGVRVLQAGCPSCQPTNSALKGYIKRVLYNSTVQHSTVQRV